MNKEVVDLFCLDSNCKFWLNIDEILFQYQEGKRMMRKWMIVLLGLIFFCSMIFLVTSCAQKQVAMETTPPAPKKSEFDADKKSKEMEEQAKRDYQAKLEEMKKKKAEEMRQPMTPKPDMQAEIRAFESKKIYFDFDRSELKPEARETLKEQAAWLKAHPEFSVRIEGNCDERGTAEYNIALGERRANAAWKYLNALGVSGNRMATVSFGEERPVDPGHNEAAWSKNRRDEFTLLK